MAGADWLVALDTQLCERHDHCTCCGRPFAQPSTYLWLVEVVGTVAVNIVVCQSCQRQPDWREQLARTLEHRYSTDRPWDDA